MARRFEPKKDFSCGGVVVDPRNKKTLLVQVTHLGGDRVWTFPKGHPEPGENEKEAALREVEEETGWRCEIVSSLMDVHYTYTHNGAPIEKTVRWFFMAPLRKAGEFDPNEILACEWVSLDEAKKRITYPSDKELISKVKSMG